MNDFDLDELLKSAKVPAAPPVGFQRDVWSRIEILESRSWKVRMFQVIEQSLSVLSRPRFAVATCTAVAIAGAWIGTVSTSSQAGKELSYLQSISPFAQPHH